MTKVDNPYGTGRAPPLTNPTTAESPLNSDIEPKISDYNSHGVHTVPPAAAKFGIGATTVEQIQQATDARREHSAQLSR